ncbi:chromatin licensing and DNA replication factor double parked [Oratosquilla oratoria]|uniref:chromatin licensing and DNA replication factor double parked n=1 Tax=Oratosquilla oratoria TaxID=337810 RepID=UPI003F75D5E2
MASTKVCLTDFYKSRKNARGIYPNKGGKQTSVHTGAPEKISTIQDKTDAEIIPVEIKQEKRHQKVEAGKQVPVQITTNKPVLVLKPQGSRNKKGVQRRTKEKPGGLVDKPNGTKFKGSNVLEAWVRSAGTNQRNDESSENTKDVESEPAPVEHQIQAGTPKRKRFEEMTPRKKSKLDGGLHEQEKTPGESGDQIMTSGERSAKKKLIMEPDFPQNSGTEKSQNEGKKQLTPAEIKERLGRCGRLDELRAKLLKVNQCGERLQQFRSNFIENTRETSALNASPKKGTVHPQLKKFSSLDVDVPISPIKSPIKTPRKTPNKTPSFKKYHHLIEKPSGTLLLPYKYKFINEVFRAVDTVASLMHNRHEVITYSKLKPAVQEMMKRAFSEKYLGQIKSVFPMAYIFKQERKKNLGGHGSRQEGEDHQLTVAVNMKYKKSPAGCNLMEKLDDGFLGSLPKFEYRKMDSVVIVERRNIFHNALIEILKQHHKEFLESLDPPIIDSLDNIRRWHPDFPLEDVPDVEVSDLPQPPNIEKFNTARLVLDKAKDMISANPKLERAVKEAAEKSMPKTQEEEVAVTAPPNLNTALKGVSLSLLEKIRAREAAKATREMTRSNTETREIEILSRLPEIARIIRNIFVTEKKAALPWEMVAAKISSSSSSMLAPSEVDKHLHMLIKEVPGWCTQHKVRAGLFLKIDKTQELSSVITKLESIIRERR